MTVVEDVNSQPAPSVEAVGDRLRAAREARGLSVADVAKALKFSPRQVELVEANAWAKLPGQTFIRGCVRNYARLLELDVGALLRDLESADLPKAAELVVPGSTNATLPQAGQSRNKELLPVLGGLVLVLLSVLAYFIVPEDFWRGNSTIVVQRPAPPPPAATSEPPPALAAKPLPAEATGPPAASESAAPAVAAGMSTVLGATGKTALRFYFDQSSWVEVRDATGKLVHAQNNAAGTEQEVSGTPPLSVIVGDARRVRIVYKDKPVDLGPFTNPQNNVARLNIE